MLCVSLTKKFRIIHSPRSFPAIIYNVGWGSGGVGGGGGGGGGISGIIYSLANGWAYFPGGLSCGVLR